MSSHCNFLFSTFFWKTKDYLIKIHLWKKRIGFIGYQSVKFKFLNFWKNHSLRSCEYSSVPYLHRTKVNKRKHHSTKPDSIGLDLCQKFNKLLQGCKIHIRYISYVYGTKGNKMETLNTSSLTTSDSDKGLE